MHQFVITRIDTLSKENIYEKMDLHCGVNVVVKGVSVGFDEGIIDGLDVGFNEGCNVGSDEGCSEGASVGFIDGLKEAHT